MNRTPSFSGLLGETAALIGDAIRPVAIFLLVMGTLNAAGAIAGLSDTEQGAYLDFMPDADSGLSSLVFKLFVLIVTVVAGYLLTSALLKLRGWSMEGSPRILAYIGLSILTAIGVVLGLLILIVPGLILAVRWSAATGFLIGGGQGVVESFGSSWQATKGHGWAIFFAGIVLIFGVLIAVGIPTGLSVLAGSEAFTEIVSAFAAEFVTVVATAFTVAIYVLVQENHGELGDVFT